MGRENATLVGGGRGDEEVEWLICLSFVARMLHQTPIDDAATRWVLQIAALIPHEEPLVDPLVHYNQGQLRRSGPLRVQLVHCLLELRDLDADDSITLGVTHAISVDDEVGWPLTIMPLLEAFDGFFKSFNESGVDDLLSSLLDQVLRVVLGHVRVRRR